MEYLKLFMRAANNEPDDVPLCTEREDEREERDSEHCRPGELQVSMDTQM
jgi:hypothetical protein